VSENNSVKEEAKKLFHDGLESKLVSFLEGLLSCCYPEQMVCSVYMHHPSLILHGPIRRVDGKLTCPQHVIVTQLRCKPFQSLCVCCKINSQVILYIGLSCHSFKCSLVLIKVFPVSKLCDVVPVDYLVQHVKNLKLGTFYGDLLCFQFVCSWYEV